MNFMTDLLKCHAYGQIYDAILIVIDHLSKKHHYIPCTKKNKGTSAKATAKLFIQHVWSRESLPISLTSNRKPQFVAKMWDFLCKLLNIKAKLSTAWHPETNGQSKIANQEMKQYLKSYVNHFQNNWVHLLLMAEFAGNVNISALIKIPPFLSSWDHIPRISFDLVVLSVFFTHKRLANAQAKSLVSRTQTELNLLSYLSDLG